jgi:drug/metabolite transporter (DMT)-like permease
MNQPSVKNNLTGILLAVLATFIWSWNFIVAKDMADKMGPVSLSFFRWTLAAVLIFPFAYQSFRTEWKAVKTSMPYFLLTALAGIALFNTFVYIGAHYTTAINLALIGTTSSPIMSVIMARIFLKERIGWTKVIGMLLCVTGVLYLLCKGNINNLLSLHFDKGDLWVLMAAFCFAVYNTMAKKKPAAISPVNFLFVAFTLGAIMLLPFFIYEVLNSPPIVWTGSMIGSIVYLGLGASVICFLIWNIAIRKLGAGRTALFGNLIPIFSSIEATLVFSEKFSDVHLISIAMVFVGILLANLRLK